MPTNIVLLADGTGNSSASPFKTNVWRLYQAIDIKVPPPAGKPRQIVYYDSGVGTENFKPLAALGGAFGIGVWKNVKALYTFVCRNFVAGDQIYGFGFSRGAFTLRLLMGLIGKCGIVKAMSDAELNRCVQMAYEAYRRDFLIRASKQRAMIYNHILGAPKYFMKDGKQLPTIDLTDCGCKQVFTDIHFVGVWDTVDAYGMPVDELKFAIDEWVWPMSFADRDPSDRLLTIRHALSLDDARPTFRPVLWNEVLVNKEKPNDPSTTVPPARIQQVWFPGVHANVGGGYPDDGMAFAALAWMMDEAAAQGLRYFDAERNEIAARVNPQGEQYDSRAGLAGYYRYGPRKVEELCADNTYKVKVPQVRVHPSAYDRIVARERAYAPVSLRGNFVVAGAATLPPDEDACENAWDLVWWRRYAYFTTLELTTFFSLFALSLVFEWPERILRHTEGWLGWAWSYVTWPLGDSATNAVVDGWSWLIGHSGAVLPSWATILLPAIKQHPLSAIVSLSLLAFTFFFWSDSLQRRIDAYAEWAWNNHKKLDPAAQPRTTLYNTIGRPARAFTALLYKAWLSAVVSVLGVAIGFVALVLFSPYWLTRVIRRKRCWMA